MWEYAIIDLEKGPGTHYLAFINEDGVYLTEDIKEAVKFKTEVSAIEYAEECCGYGMSEYKIQLIYL